MRYSFLAFVCVSWASLFAQQYTEDQIRTWTTTFGNWNMQVDHIKWYNYTTVPPFTYDQIIGVDAVVFSDETKPEVFNFTRQSGERDPVRPSFSKSRSGGYLEVWRFTPSTAYYPLYLKLDRIPCPRPSWDEGGCQPGVLRDGFFAADDATFTGRPSRRFSNTAKTRGAVKIDYLCTNCGASTVNTIWVDLGSWNMQTVKSKTFDIDGYNVPPASVIGMSAAIQSDPDPSGKVEVDNLEHISTSGNALIRGRMRGGALWWGYGCGGDSPYGYCKETSNPPYSKYKLIAYRGPSKTGGKRNGYSNYASTPTEYYEVMGPDGTTPLENRSIRYSGAGRRGWVKIEYTGAKSATPVPYAMKTRALKLGPWSMTQSTHHSVDFNSLNVAASRVTSIYTGILSDKACVGDGRKATNFHRPYHSSGHDIDSPDEMAGGVTFIDEKDGKIRFARINRMGPEQGYYSSCHDGNVDNRGFVKMDILVGSCAEGPSGFKIQGIPGTQVGDCAGNASTFTLEGAGDDIWGNADDFTFVHNAGSGDIDIRVKIESQAAFNEWAKAGIMIRDGLGQGARHASILVTPDIGGNTHGAHLNWRSSTGGLTDFRPNNTSGSPFNSIHAPYYLRLVKQGQNFTAYARSSSSSSWTTIWAAQISGFPSTYYYGLAQSSHDKNLAKTVFSEFTTRPVSGSTYRIINVHSGKALDVAGASTSNGGNVHQWTYGGGGNQKWQAVENSQGYWKLINQNSGKVLDVSGGPSATGDGANVHQWTDLNVTNLNGTNQQWQVTDLGVGIYRVTARHSGKALDVSGASMDNGANVHQWTYGNGNNQKWRFMSP